jgi:hypothetical protein
VCVLVGVTLPGTLPTEGQLVARDSSGETKRVFNFAVLSTGALQTQGFVAGSSTGGAASIVASSAGAVVGGGTYLLRARFESAANSKFWKSDGSGGRTLVADTNRTNGALNESETTVPLTLGCRLNVGSPTAGLLGGTFYYLAVYRGDISTDDQALAWTRGLNAMAAKGLNVGGA